MTTSPELVFFNSQSHVDQVKGVSWWQDKATIERGRKNDNVDFQLVTIPCICCSHVSYCSLACRQLAKGDLGFNFQPDYLFFLLPPPWQTITKKIIFPSQRPTTNMNAELETSWRPSPDRKPRGTSADFASEWVRGKCFSSFSDLC